MFQCSRCSEAFIDNSQLVEHQRREVLCPINDETSHVGISELQLQELENTLKRREPAKRKTECDKWCEIYRILFPEVNEADIPSPCKLQPPN